MIARLWRGRAAGAISGYRGARVLRSGLEFLVITEWDSMDAVRRFAGDDPQVAVVEPEARAVLSEFDEAVRHYEVVGE